MYLILDKATQAILHMSNSAPGPAPKPEDLLPGFNADTMLFGRAPQQFIPLRFAIVDGVVQDLDAPAAPAAAAAPAGVQRAAVGAAALAEGVPAEADLALAPGVPADDSALPGETLAQTKQRLTADLTSQSLAARQALLPDYQLLNAGLGLYDEARTSTIKLTVQAFQAEVRRVEALIGKARYAKELAGLRPTFPQALVTPQSLVKSATEQLAEAVKQAGKAAGGKKS